MRGVHINEPSDIVQNELIDLSFTSCLAFKGGLLRLQVIQPCKDILPDGRYFEVQIQALLVHFKQLKQVNPHLKHG